MSDTHAQAHGGGGGSARDDKSAKKSTFSYKMSQKWIFFGRGLRGAKLKKFTFVGSFTPLSILATGLTMP